MSRIRTAGGYRKTASFQTATLIYDATYWFCEKFLDCRSRMVDQMVQAARSGRQNIAGGAEPPPRLRKQNYGCLTPPAQASRNCFSTSRTTCATGTYPNGRRILPKPWLSGRCRSGPKTISLIGLI